MLTLSYSEFVAKNPGIEDRLLQLAQQIRDAGEKISLGKLEHFVMIERVIEGLPVVPSPALSSHWFSCEIHQTLITRDPTLHGVVFLSRSSKRLLRRQRLEATIDQNARVFPA